MTAFFNVVFWPHNVKQLIDWYLFTRKYYFIWRHYWFMLIIQFNCTVYIVRLLKSSVLTSTFWILFAWFGGNSSWCYWSDLSDDGVILDIKVSSIWRHLLINLSALFMSFLYVLMWFFCAILLDDVDMISISMQFYVMMLIWFA